MQLSLSINSYILIPRLTLDNFPWVVFQSCERLYAFCSQYYSQCHLSKHNIAYLFCQTTPHSLIVYSCATFNGRFNV